MGALSRGWWLRPAPLPVHLLLGDHPLVDAVLHGLLAGAVVLRLIAVPAVVWIGGPWTLLPVGAGLAALFALDRRAPRPTARPLGLEALFFGGCAVLSVLALGTSGAGALTTGALASIVLIIGLGAAIWAVWGRRPAVVPMRQPRFRVLGDNPATLNLVGRVRIGDQPLRIVLPRCADGPVSAVLYSPRALAAVARVSWDQIRLDYESGGAVAVLHAPPGRYLLGVRYYRPWAAWLPPVIAR